MKIALTGATGLVGSRFFDLYKSHYDIIPISSSYGVDITDSKNISRFLSQKNPALILHFAAKTNVDACEDDREDDMKILKKGKVYQDGKVDFEKIDVGAWKGSVSAFGINAIGTKNLADYAKGKNIKIIYISTDFVFNGEKDGEYTEEDETDPIDWYGQTKLYGEQTLSGEFLITRISYPFGYRSNLKKDLIWTLVDLLKTQDGLKLISDQIITPTFIDDIARGLDFLIEMNASGMINLVGNNYLSPYDIGIALAREFSLPESKIELTTRAELYKGRAARPFKVMLKNDKLRGLGFQMTDFFEAIGRIKESA